MTKENRRDHGTGALYQRTRDGHWVGSVTLPAGPDGKRRRKTISSKNKATAIRKLRDLNREVSEHGDIVTTAMTVEQWLRYWLEHIAPARCRPSTLYSYGTYIDNYLVPQLGRYKVNALTADHVRTMLASMGDKSEATRRQAFAIIKRAMTVAQREGKTRVNPCTVMDPPKVPTVHRTPFTLDEARKIIGALDAEADPSGASRWLCALLEGVRQGEALGLLWEDVDLDRGRIVIRHALQRRVGQGLVLVPPKSKSSERSIPMLPAVHLAMSLMPSREGYVWGGEQPTDPRDDWDAWKALLERAGVPHRPLHAARNTTGSLLDAAGVSSKVISEILGHAGDTITRKAYIHGDEERHVEAMGSLNRLIAGQD